MAKDARLVRDPHQKEIVRLFSAFDGSKNRRKIFEDFITVSACAVSNLLDTVHYEEREKRYLDTVRQYKRNEIDVFAKMYGQIELGVEEKPDQDFLGEMYMALDFGSAAAGQFFTPYDVCRCMAAINTDYDRLNAQIADQGFIGVMDPACGAGALLVAFANECKKAGINYHRSVLFVAQDVDYIVGMMCYLALSCMGCAGIVCIGDSLINPVTFHDKRGLLPIDTDGRIWYTPQFLMAPEWAGRQLAARMDLIANGGRSEREPESVADETPVKAPPREAPPPAAAEKAETPVVISPEPEKPVEAEETAYGDNEFGQLMFF